MKVECQDTLIVNGGELKGDYKIISLPFTQISVRAMILRISDGAILGALHGPDGKYALPGGAIDDGEKAEDALVSIQQRKHSFEAVAVCPEPCYHLISDIV